MSAISKIIFAGILGGACLIGTINATDKPADDKPADASEPIEASLVYSDDWAVLSKISTPLPAITQINNNYVTIPNPENQKGFRCVGEPDKARLDTDGDEEFDTDIKSKEQFVAYKIKYPNELKMNYKVRFFTSGKTPSGGPLWSYQRACFMTAKTPLETFILIDDNTNGSYGDYGKDAIAIGSSKQAGPLSAVISVKGKFYKLEVQTLAELTGTQMKDPKFTGMTLRLTPCEEETGKLDLVKNLKPPKGSPQAIIIRRGEDAFFQLNSKGETVLPIGEYYLVSAIFTPRVRARTSEKPIAVIEKDKSVAPKWGAPFKLDINAFCEKGGTEIIVIPPGNLTPPQDVSKNLECPFIKCDFPRILGSLGEEYYAPDEFKDEGGYAFPDESVTSFSVDIRPKGAQANDKPLNKRGNPFTDRWIQTDMSGLVQKSIPYWNTYRCPIERYRGKVIFKVSAKSAVFGELSFEKEIEVTE
ncbi:MAG: hypothetical protein HZA49_08060 [Planctomycetes bacterium]|nr:hypothetical protein [Planctomycetota bacterium]